MDVSPKYLMKLVDEVEAKIWADFSSYKKVKNYIQKWHNWDYNWENFCIYESNGNINLNETLHNIDSETLLKIAMDLGVETPGFIPSIPIIKNVLKANYSNASNSFEKAIKQIEENQDVAIGLANSTLESIIKHILENDQIAEKCDKKHTLYGLTQDVLKEFAFFPNGQVSKEIRDIGSSLLKASQSIECLRSEKTTFHGKAKSDYIINDPLYAYFVVNTVSTIGLFLIGFYEKKYNNVSIGSSETTEEEINIINYHYRIGINDPGYGVVIDNSEQTPEETANEILKRI